MRLATYRDLRPASQFAIRPWRIDPVRLANNAEQTSGIRLRPSGGLGAHGYIFTLHRPSGPAGICGLCESTLSEESPHDCFEIVLYDDAGVTDTQKGELQLVLEAEIQDAAEPS